MRFPVSRTTWKKSKRKNSSTNLVGFAADMKMSWQTSADIGRSHRQNFAGEVSLDFT